MKKIINWLQSNLDKVCHFCICLILALCFAYLILQIFNFPLALCAWFGFVGSMSIGALKEIYDLKRGNIFDSKDLLADWLGASVGFIMAIIML